MSFLQFSYEEAFLGKKFHGSRLRCKSCDLVTHLKDVSVLHVVTESEVEGEIDHLEIDCKLHSE